MHNGHCECGRIQFEFDGDPPRPTVYLIYVGSKAPWHEIADDLQQYDTEPAD